MRSSSGCSGFRPGGVDRILVHAARVVVADFLLVGRVLRAFLVSDLVEQLVQARLGVVVDDEERVIARLVGRNGIKLGEFPHAYCTKLTQGSADRVHEFLVEAGQQLRRAWFRRWMSGLRACARALWPSISQQSSAPLQQQVDHADTTKNRFIVLPPETDCRRL